MDSPFLTQFVTEWQPLLDYDYDNDNRSAIASLTTSCFPAQQAVEVLMELLSAIPVEQRSSS